MTILALLARLGCLPEECTHAVAGSTDSWRRCLQPGQVPSAEPALPAALAGDTEAVWRYAAAASSPDVRPTALGTAGAHLTGAPVTLSTDNRADNRGS
ncbi:hypothetical protein [Streptomyces sp. NPDC088727]|uniref:hypothetical protein n=1 Tax=Streptomyces sp. NPDC088727 TaxID=3365875 RepID=UPI003817AEE9